VPIELDYEFLKKTTNDFDDLHVNQGGRKLGEGGFGIVYVGTLAYQQGESMNVTLLRRNAARSVYFNLYLWNIGKNSPFV
jgi:hypothetical protein